MLLIRKGNPEHVESLETLCGKTVSTVQGSTQIALVDETSAKCTAAGKPPIENLQYAQPADARLQVQYGPRGRVPRQFAGHGVPRQDRRRRQRSSTWCRATSTSRCRSASAWRSRIPQLRDALQEGARRADRRRHVSQDPREARRRERRGDAPRRSTAARTSSSSGARPRPPHDPQSSRGAGPGCGWGARWWRAGGAAGAVDLPQPEHPSRRHRCSTSSRRRSSPACARRSCSRCSRR